MPVRPGPLGHIDLDESEDAPPISQQLVSALMANAGKVIDLFASWDADQSGTVSRREFHRAMKALGLDVKAPHIDEIFSAWDRDQSGMITLDELRSTLQAAATTSKSILALRKLMAKKGIKRQLLNAFKTWDASGDGELDMIEFSKALQFVGLTLSGDQLRALFSAIDRDGMIVPPSPDWNGSSLPACLPA